MWRYSAIYNSCTDNCEGPHLYAGKYPSWWLSYKAAKREFAYDVGAIKVFIFKEKEE